MTLLKKTAVTALAIAMTATLLPTMAEARDWRDGRYGTGYGYGDRVVVERHVNRHRSHRHHRGHVYRHHNDNGGAVIAGAIIGLAAGAIIAGALDQPDAYVVGPAPTYGGHVGHVGHAPEPFSREWYAYCSAKYRSFDAATGTFQPYHGPRRLCR
ncbi:MAG: BA14K family protein [Pseudomonadota bacterium]